MPTPSSDDEIRLSYNTLRVGIGVLGVALPFLLVLGNWGPLQTSLSDYYYTNMRDFLEGVLFFLAFFLFAYRPYGQDGWADNLITSIAGGFALITALFPTVNQLLGHVPTALVLQFIPLDWSGFLHKLGSGGLLTCFAVMALFYFTRTSGTPTPGKILRNWIYIGTGVGMVLCLLIVAFSAITAGPGGTDTLAIFFPEAIALVLFGFSWLVKGGVFFGDN